jgi:ABC-type branched-subunit amino acid transport system substrate-binding protein
VFPSPFILHENTEQYVTFSAAYQKRIGSKPSRLACLGYDAVRMIAGGVAAGAGTRSELIAYLSRQTDIAGSAGPVRFGKFRENTAMPIYRVQSGQAVSLEVAGTASPKR